MGIVSVTYYGSAKVTLIEPDLPPEQLEAECAKNRQALDAVLHRILSKPENAERLRKINKERYGIE